MEKKFLDLVIANGETIIRSKAKSDDAYKAWYTQAEAALQKVFGDDWSVFVLWEGYRREDSWGSDIARLRRAVDIIKNSISLIPDASPPMDTPPVHENQPTVPEITDSHDKPRIFIVHGHDEVTKLELKNYLQNTLKMPEPIILHEKPNQGRAIIEKFEQYASKATFAFVLLTPDDILAQQETSGSKLHRARQNVIFEMGYFLGLFGRKAGRVILLYKGELDIPSDISGLVYIDISNGIESSGEKIRRELAPFL